jgi:23S rRNA pseudouridine1911/1915/1917 synthase
LEKRENALGVVRIQIARGLIGQQKRGTMDQGPRHGSSLHFPPAHLMGKSTRPGRQAGQIEQLHGAHPGRTGLVAAEEEGKFHVFHRRHGRQQVEKLEDHAQLRAAVGRENRVIGPVETQVSDPDLAGCRLVKSPQQIEQRAFAATARSRHRGKGAWRNFQVQVAQGVHFTRRRLVYSRDMAEPDHQDPKGFQAARRAQDNFRVVAEGEDWIAVDKPAGLLTHPTRPDGSPTLWDGLRALLAYELANRGRLSIITRLDRETSGLVLLALSPARARALGLSMQRGEIGKQYLAIVDGSPDWDKKTIEMPIVRQGEVRDSKIWLKRCVHERGAPARTDFVVEERFVREGRAMALIRAHPRTGRTHQIRVHLSHAGFPVVGDKIYGRREEAYLDFIATGWTPGLEQELILPRHALHACGLAFADGREKHELTVGLPADMEALRKGARPCGSTGFGR